MDNIKYIKGLLTKFYEGETSLSEETELIAFFEKDEVPENLADEKKIFLALRDVTSPIEIPDDLANKILLNLENVKNNEDRGRRISLFSLSGLAAGLLILLSVYLGIIRNNNGKDQLAQYAIEDPEVAYQEIVKTLNFVSNKWNLGADELKNLNNIQKGMNSIQPINKISSGSRELNLLGNLRRAEGIQVQ